MNRLQKKCLIAVAGTHLLAVVALLCSGFIRPSPTPDNSQVLDMIPAKLIDQAFSSGVQSATPPPPLPPAPPVQQEQQPPQTEPPKPAPPVKVVDPTPPPEAIKPVDPIEPKPPKPQHPMKISLVPVVLNKNTQPDSSAAEAAKAEREAKRLRDKQAKAFQDAARAIKDNTSTATKIEMPGTGSVSYANYASVVKSIYEREWRTPDNASSDDADTRVSVIIGRDGSVISARILTPSGDPKVDASVQQTLDHVTFIAPFPDGATERQKEFIITFNLKLKRMLG